MTTQPTSMSDGSDRSDGLDEYFSIKAQIGSDHYHFQWVGQTKQGDRDFQMPAKDYLQRRNILNALNKLCRGQTREIANSLGPGWLEPSKNAALRAMIRIMLREGLVQYVGSGQYSGCSWCSETHDDIIRDLVGLVKEAGTATSAELLDAMTDDRLWGPDELEVRHRHILQSISESGRFKCSAGDKWSLAH